MSKGTCEHGTFAPNRKRLIADLCGLVSVRSVNPFYDPPEPGRREQEFADDLLRRLETLGLETGRRELVPGRPNVWGRLKGRGPGPSVMLAAHMDTFGVDGYENPFDPVIQSDCVFGRGSCDMKAALACYLETVRLLRENEFALDGDLIIAGICDEEHVMLGSRDFGLNGPWADFGIIGEPTELAVCPSHKGQLAVRFRTIGRATHSSVPERGINAVEAMGAVIGAFADYNRELLSTETAHPLCGKGRFSMNVIRGGENVSAVPDLCELEVDRRYLPGESVAKIIEGYRERLHELAAHRPGLQFEISEPTLHVKPLDVPVDSPIVGAMRDAARLTLGVVPAISAFPGGSDAPNLGFPCVICGPGSLEQAHSTSEFVEIGQMVDATSIYLSTILNLTNGSPT